MPKAKTSTPRSSTTRASWSIWAGAVELRLVAHEVVDPAARREPARRLVPRSPGRRRPRRAGDARPSREESSPAPARSSRVKIRPSRPRARWLWSIWRASVDLPQSIVPEKKTSSATAQTTVRRGAGAASLAAGVSGAVHADQRDDAGVWRARVDDHVARRAATTTSPTSAAPLGRPGRTSPRATASSRARTQRRSPSTSRQRAATAGRGARARRRRGGARLAAEQGDAGAQLRVVATSMRGPVDVDHAVVGGDEQERAARAAARARRASSPSSASTASPHCHEPQPCSWPMSSTSP